MELISKHLNRNFLKLKIHTGKTVCSFSGKEIDEYVLNKDLIKDTFTDHSFIKNGSGHTSISIALCLSEVIPSQKPGVFNSLRCYSYYADEERLKILRREEMLDLLFEKKASDYVFCVSYDNKKHTAFKCQSNDKEATKIRVQTDIDEKGVEVDLQNVLTYLDVLKSWYTITKNTNTQPTRFNKSHILGTCYPDFRAIKEYGFEKFYEEDHFLNNFRSTKEFELITHMLVKQL